LPYILRKRHEIKPSIFCVDGCKIYIFRFWHKSYEAEWVACAMTDVRVQLSPLCSHRIAPHTLLLASSSLFVCFYVFRASFDKQITHVSSLLPFYLFK
jgi:hypothetical protein